MEKEHDKNWFAIKEDCKTMCGRYADGHNQGEVIVLGAVDHADDYYWVCATKNCNIVYHSCVGNPDLYPVENITKEPDGKLVHTHTKFFHRLSPDERKKFLDNAYKKVIEDTRWSGFNYLKFYNLGFNDDENIAEFVSDRILNPKDYMLGWISEDNLVFDTENNVNEPALERARAALGSGAYDDETIMFLFPELRHKV